MAQLTTDAPLYEKLSAEKESKDLFNQAKAYAFDYMDDVDRSVAPSDMAIEALSHFNEPLPDFFQDGGDVLKMLHEFGSPATVYQTGGRYFGFVNGNVLPVAAAAHWITDVWDQNTALFAMSPIASKLEEIAEKWIVDLLGLTPDTAIGLVGGSSVASMCALAAARNSLLAKKGWCVPTDGLFGAPTLRVVIGEGAHGSLYKALSLLGLGKRFVEIVPCDNQGRMILEKIPELDATCLVIVQAGHVCTGSFDNIDHICDKAAAVGAWVHVDGAFGLWAAASESLKYLTAGIEKADSCSVDGHKTLNTPYDCGILICKHRAALKAAMAAEGSYLQESSIGRDCMFYSPDMSRRARSVDLWVTLKYLGRRGVATMINDMVARAKEFGEQLSLLEGFVVLNDIVFNQCLVRCETPEVTEAALRSIQASGVAWCGGAKWDGVPVIRISCCSWATTPQDVTRVVNTFDTARRQHLQQPL